MKVTEILARGGPPCLSFELIPPERGGSLAGLIALVETLMPFRPAFIDVTSHAAEVTYDECGNGTLRRHIKRKRPGTIGLCAALRYRFGVETVPHLLCNGFTREETEDALIELDYLGIENVMALQGDDRVVRKPLAPDRTRNEHAVDLVAQIAAMNRGSYLHDLVDAAPTGFCVGVAGYPERHFEAPNDRWDIGYLQQKLAAGADYVVTQMIFDNARYFDFVQRCRDAGIVAPIVPGLKILARKKQLVSLPRAFHIEVPEALADAVQAAPPEQVAAIGIDWAVRQADELLGRGVPGVHFYILQSSREIAPVLQRLFKARL